MSTARRKGTFHQSDISNGKRLARGQHWLFARTHLRARDMVHNRRWKVLMMAGEAPAGEIRCIRELLPLAKIVAIDRHVTAVQAARAEGADEVYLVPDATALVKSQPGVASSKFIPACTNEIGSDFDVIHLDLCSPLGAATSQVVRAWERLLRKGMFILTFPYGRDVLEVFANTDDTRPDDREQLKALRKQNCPKNIIDRLLFLFDRGLPNKCSILIYRGHKMPMCSIAFLPKFQFRGDWPGRGGCSFCALTATDAEDAFVEPIDWCKVYDTPLSVIQELRRRRSARKAANTSRERRQRLSERRTKQTNLPLLPEDD
jgi:hypothetical protein